MQTTLRFSRPGDAWLWGAAALLLGLLALALLAGRFLAPAGGPAGGPAGEAETQLALSTRPMAYSRAQLTVNPGLVTLTLRNSDFLPHSFTVDELGVDLELAAGQAGAVTFEAPAGRYDFYCAVPGHRDAGMVGTLVVAP